MIDEYITQVTHFSRIHPRVLVDIGAFDGEYSRKVQTTFCLSQQDIYLVEPNPDMQTLLQGQFPEANRFELAVAGTARRLRLNRVTWPIMEGMPCSSVPERIDAWSQYLRYQPVHVDAITGKTLLARICKPVDMCIIDVEGLSYEVIASFEDDLSNIKSLMAECEHAEIFRGQKLFNDVSALLSEKGFRQMAFRYSYSNQSDSVWIQEQYVDLAFKPPPPAT